MIFSGRVLLKLGVLLAGGIILVRSEKCASRDFGNGGTVCVCNATYCDTSEPVKPVPSNQYIVITSNKAGLRFNKEIKNFTNNTSGKQCPIPKSDKLCERGRKTDFKVCGVTPKSLLIPGSTIYIDSTIGYQEIKGFGGAITDAAVINVANMSAPLKKHLLRSYYSQDGLDYNIARVPMGSSDFSTRLYSYIDSDTHTVNCVDPTLKNFQLAPEDINLKIPFIHEALKLQKNLKLFTSTWVIPKAYKENNSYKGFLGFVRKEVYQLLADYYVKFLDSYKQHNLTFWGLTTSNEPFIAMAEYVGTPGTLWYPEDLGIWIRDNLGPTLKKSAHKHVILMTVDDQRSLLPFVPQILRDNKTLQYVDGIAVHFYEDLNNNTYLLDDVHKQYPDKFLLATEACVGSMGIVLGSWSNAEIYASDIMQDLNHWVTGWVDWNIVLNNKGGPNVAAGMDSPIINYNSEFYKQPLYYAIGHYSKYLPVGSKRIYSSQCNDDHLVSQVAFKRPDGGIAVIILNKHDQQVQRKLVDCKRNSITLNLSARSITTVLYW
ncbi:putative glucosylceramidase 3 [Diabrotica undecimpunctata]|uniref:putative glucosylceramidase 3 n=1 Tax=Diabrotica undecimpunctata TaxID=50387 RepID=UPI003B63C8AA